MNITPDGQENEDPAVSAAAGKPPIDPRLAAYEAENLRLHELLSEAARLYATDEHKLADLLASAQALALSRAETKEGQNLLLASAQALALSRKETKEGQTDLLASAQALALSRKATKEGQTDLLASAQALALAREETKDGQTDLLASVQALALSRKETKEGQTDLLASALALALSRAETKDGQTDLLASAQALALSREETREGQTDLLASAQALALSRAETKEGQTDLLASAAINKAMSLAHALLVTGNAALRKSEERFRRLVEAMPNAMVMINAAGRIEMVNAQTERLFGYARSELVGAPIEMLLPANSRTHHPSLRSGFFAKPTSRPMGVGRALFGLKKNGSEVEVEIGLSPIETDDGLMVLSAIVDISSRVRLEGQVRQSQKMHAIGRVIAGVAHDFNNMLQALSGALEMLLDSVTDRPKAVDWGKIALRATKQGEELTNRLLSFSRQRILTAQPIIVNTLFSELKELINHLFESNITAKTKLEIMPCPPNLAVLADLAQLEAALINLAVNSLDAMRAGGCLHISAYEIDSDSTIVPQGRYTVISVVDTGSGMDVDTLAQAFDPFFTTKGANGTGLGLSMVQGFARQSGGEAQITSVVGEGTTIDLWLPSATGRSEVVAPVAALTRMGGHILLVDDSQDALVVVTAFLRFAGLEVTSRMSGDLALAELAGGNRFDAIITDFAMPGMNGMELLTLAHEIDPSMSAMIITGFSDPKLLTMMNGVVTLRKPFNRAELAETVHKLLAAKHILEPIPPT